MRRGAASLVGFVLGLTWVWCCLYSLGHMDWARSNAQPSCVDAGDCSPPQVVFAICYVLAPPIIFGVLTGTAWRRWTARKWAGWFLGLSFLTALFYAVMAVIAR